MSISETDIITTGPFLCPWCGGINLVQTPPIPEGYFYFAPCEHCGHLLEVARIAGQYQIFPASRTNIERLEPKARKEVYEAQEKTHHELGNWG